MKRIVAPLLLLYAVLLAVNLFVNYGYYQAGGSWVFSITFSLAVATVGWLGYMLVYQRFSGHRLSWRTHPTRNFALTVAGSGLYGMLVMVLARKSLVLMDRAGSSSSFYDNLGDLAYAALFSMLFGLIVHGQEFLRRLQQSTRDNERMQTELLKSQHEALKAQIRPHFLFNALNTLAGLIPEEPEIAVRFVQGLSAVLRYALQHNDAAITLETELKVAESFIFLNRQRFGDRLHVHVDIAPGVRTKLIAAHGLLTLLENAIKHNEISVESPLRIDIFNPDGDSLCVANTYQPKSLPGASLGLGLPNIIDRYAMLCDRPVTVEKGAQFTVTIPLLSA